MKLLEWWDMLLVATYVKSQFIFWEELAWTWGHTQLIYHRATRWHLGVGVVLIQVSLKVFNSQWCQLINVTNDMLISDDSRSLVNIARTLFKTMTLWKYGIFAMESVLFNSQWCQLIHVTNDILISDDSRSFVNIARSFLKPWHFETTAYLPWIRRNPATLGGWG